MGSWQGSAASPVFRRGFSTPTCLTKERLSIGCCNPGRRCAGREPVLAAPAAVPVCYREHAWKGELSGEVEGQADMKEECGGDGCSALLWFLPMPPSSDDV